MAIRILPPEEARKIAAGEVVDRPAALVREFIDNALDAGARNIETAIEEGGVLSVEVSDDGCGMDKDDLALCTCDHSTSKITSIEDLLHARTLGFRGEALASAAAVSELEIISGTAGGSAWQLYANFGGNIQLEKSVRQKGTTVRARYLFDRVPARKRFLKNTASEASACKQVFLEKAAAFPAVSFRFVQDGVLKVFLPAVSSLKERFASSFGLDQYLSALYQVEAAGEGFAVHIIAGSPETARPDRKKQAVFANGRRIQDWWLLHAFEAGLQGGFPNALHPVGAVFLDIEPHLVDFNIHPAKREAKFNRPSEIHHAVSSALKTFLRNLLEKESHEQRSAQTSLWNKGASAQFANPEQPAGDEIKYRALAEAVLSDRVAVTNDDGASGCLKFIGRLWGIFILVEKGGRLFIIDQHAAHERVLYDECLNGHIRCEPLLVPITFSTENLDDDAFLRRSREELAALGVKLEEDGAHNWRISALPEGWRAPDSKTIEAVLALPRRGTGFVESWAASTACHAAIRDGAYLDEEAALSLASRAMALPIQRCPHGRPIWVEISRESLLKGIMRV